MCEDLDCPSYIADGLSDMATSASNGFCNPVLILSSLRSDLAVTMFVSQGNKTANVMSVNARTYALFQCGTGFLGIYLRSGTNTSQIVPLRPLQDDSRTVQIHAKSHPLNSYGTIHSYVSSNGQVYSSGPCDIFSPSACGLLVPDKDFDASDATSLVNYITSSLDLNIAELKTEANAILANTNSMIPTYTNSTPLPTALGFLYFFVERTTQLSLYITTSGELMLSIVVEITQSYSSVPSAYSSLVGAMISGVAAAVPPSGDVHTPSVSQISQVAASVSGISVSMVTVSSILEPSTARLFGQSQFAAKLHVSISEFKFSNAVHSSILPTISDYLY